MGEHMQLILNLQGNSLVCDVLEGQTVEDLKFAIAKDCGLDEESMMLIGEGVELDDEMIVSETGLNELNIETEVKGEGKGGKRKKKIYKTAKRVAHKHVNIKMRALKHWAFQSNGEVKKALKQCPHCVAGVMMSDHWNRCYCGKCHLTLIKENAPKEPPKKKVVAKVEEVVEETGKGKGKKGKK